MLKRFNGISPPPVNPTSMYPSDICFAFGVFRLFPAQQRLLRNGTPVAVGGRAMDILLALVEQAGQVVDRETLTNRAWPTTVVEDSNLRAQVAALRRALGDTGSRQQGSQPLIATVSGRGYRFTGVVSRDSGTTATALPVAMELLRAETSPPSSVARIQGNLPVRLTRMVGRTEAVFAIAGKLRDRRFVTITGAGGIGKTTVALAVASSLAGSYPDGVFHVDFAPLADPRLLPGALAAALGIAPGNAAPEVAIGHYVENRRMLIVFDCCEHVLDASSFLAESLLKQSPGLYLIATSREPLRADGEQVYRLAPLTSPPPDVEPSAEQALAYPAVQLFVERVTANHHQFELTDPEAPLVADICRRLDGIALAIELGAGRVDAFGIHGLATLLDDRFRLLMLGRRTASPRHRTLAAMLDWSYQSLPERQQVLLRRLALFPGTFAFDAVRAVAGSTVDEGGLIFLLADLVGKSLVSADTAGPVPRYRLLHITRAYALDRLNDAGETREVGRFAARHLLTLLKQHAPTAGKEVNGSAAHGSPIAWEIDNVRAMLALAWSDDADASLALELTAATVPLWSTLFLFGECSRWVDRALATDPHTTLARSSLDSGLQLELWRARAAALTHRDGGGETMRAAWQEVFVRAEQINDMERQVQALWGVWAAQRNAGDYGSAFETARHAALLAAHTGNAAHVALSDRILGTTHMYRGELEEARSRLKSSIEYYSTVEPVKRIGELLQFDQLVVARAFDAQVLMLQGDMEEALAAAASNLDDALATNHLPTVLYALAYGACPVALYTGNAEIAERYVTMLLHDTSQVGLEAWHEVAQLFAGMLAVLRDGPTAGLPVLKAALEAVAPIGQGPAYSLAQMAYCDALTRSGDVANARIAVDAALKRASGCDEAWTMPELLRIKSEVLFQDPALHPEVARAAAEARLLRALAIARRNGAELWARRCAESLIRLAHAREPSALPLTDNES
ncbi:putative ATPase/DNA-binding winged helix-turn-helix (wHTH) protein [Paraburkholderia sp. CI2]|uniref:ATP-binding protein n=1 Tax=Paraburkholderia sp. CI2 TaxID=2723093 RepID=UPI001614D1A8|nr:winged helix-turn-helix domain-containing protein [Paraburkholderia sp. CI2]MBB5466790.1 putative ATPase/DNA-binding winged helix-turn-helix (wHTH) protein [Paraburkholderia sp. CI2]